MPASLLLKVDTLTTFLQLLRHTASVDAGIVEVGQAFVIVVADYQCNALGRLGRRYTER